MLAVIFRANIKQLDDEYARMVQKLHDLALNQYGCRDIISVAEGDSEITVSYWDNMEQIQAWKQDAEHQVAQQLGRERWYNDYRVQVVEVLRDYASR